MSRRTVVEYDGKEHFPAPTIFHLEVEGQQPRRTVFDTRDRDAMRQLINETIEDCRKQGFDFNAIVVKRPSGDNELWKCQSHIHWGVVDRLDTYPPNMDINNWTPIIVKWFTPAAHEGKQTEGFFQEELFVVHSHLDIQILNGIFLAQE